MIYLNIGTWMPTLVSDQEKQKRHSSAKNIDDSSGSDAKTSDRGAQSSEKPKTAFGPGKVKVDDSSGMQKKQDEKRATDKTKNYFRPGKVKVDDSRGTEKSQTSKDDKSKSYFRPGKVKVDDSRGTENTKKAEPKVVVKTTEVKVTEQKVKAVFDTLEKVNFTNLYGKRSDRLDPTKTPNPDMVMALKALKDVGFDPGLPYDKQPPAAQEMIRRLRDKYRNQERSIDDDTTDSVYNRMSREHRKRTTDEEIRRMLYRMYSSHTLQSERREAGFDTDYWGNHLDFIPDKQVLGYRSKY